jgi:hypothetical protein
MGFLAKKCPADRLSGILGYLLVFLGFFRHKLPANRHADADHQHNCSGDAHRQHNLADQGEDHVAAGLGKALGIDGDVRESLAGEGPTGQRHTGQRGGFSQQPGDGQQDAPPAQPALERAYNHQGDQQQENERNQQSQTHDCARKLYVVNQRRMLIGPQDHDLIGDGSDFGLQASSD